MTTYEWYCAICGNVNHMPEEGGTLPVKCDHEPDSDHMHVTAIERKYLGTVNSIAGLSEATRAA